jgi:hypothetical protein
MAQPERSEARSYRGDQWCNQRQRMVQLDTRSGPGPAQARLSQRDSQRDPNATAMRSDWDSDWDDRTRQTLVESRPTFPAIYARHPVPFGHD